MNFSAAALAMGHTAPTGDVTTTDAEDMQQRMIKLERTVEALKIDNDYKSEQIDRLNSHMEQQPAFIRETCLEEENKHLVFIAIEKFYVSRKSEIDPSDIEGLAALDRWFDDAKKRRASKIACASGVVGGVACGVAGAVIAGFLITGCCTGLVIGGAILAGVVAGGIGYFLFRAIGGGLVWLYAKVHEPKDLKKNVKKD